MARLLAEIDWSESLLPMPEDPEWAKEVTRIFGGDRPMYRYPARSPWLRLALAQVSQIRPRHVSEKLVWLAILVTSQENSCRYCYGSARAYLKMLGLGPSQLDRVERDVQLAGTGDAERALLHFCRNLSRSSPRPARAELEALAARGYDPRALVEIAVVVASACFSNRVATFLAVPLDSGIETFEMGPLQRLMFQAMRIFGPTYPRPLPPAAATQPAPGQFADIVGLVAGTDGATVFGEALRGAFASPVLPTRTKAFMFAVVAQALDCRICEAGARRLLEGEGVPAATQARIVAALAGPELDATESVLLPWARETAHYQTEVMQRKTRELRQRLGDDVALEAIGLAALANACARLSLLGQ